MKQLTAVLCCAVCFLLGLKAGRCYRGNGEALPGVQPRPIARKRERPSAEEQWRSLLAYDGIAAKEGGKQP